MYLSNKNYIVNLITRIGALCNKIIINIGSNIILCMYLLLYIFTVKFYYKKIHFIIKEIYFLGSKSIVIIAASGFFVGMVLALQGYNNLVNFGSTGILGTMVALSLMRELSPVLTAILFASRAGSAVTAGIGIMKTTEQLDAMKIMGIDPIKYTMSYKFFAGIISMPMLCILFTASGIFGAYWVGVVQIGLDENTFYAQMVSSVDFYTDFLNGVFKSFIFSLLIMLISINNGLNSIATSEGVASATTNTVVYSSLIILVFDFILTAFMF